jgi:pyruvate dehydrogenase E2 component (dihydrolipoamide acetyltransferase)
MEEGTLAKWLVKEGDTVKSGQIIAEIETDKATMEFEAVDEGVIGKILVAEGTEGVKVNTPIAVLVEEGESADAAPPRRQGRRPGPGGCRCSGPGRRAAPAPAAAPRRRAGLCLAAGPADRGGKGAGPERRSRAPARMAASSRPMSKGAKPAAPRPPLRPRPLRPPPGRQRPAPACHAHRSVDRNGAEDVRRPRLTEVRSTACAAPSRRA